MICLLQRVSSGVARRWITAASCSARRPHKAPPEMPMITRAERLADFTTDAGPALQALVEVLCEDHVGTYLLPFLCRLAPEGFRNARTGELIEGRVVGWREPKPSSPR